jgi:hypothetical protein
MSKKERRPIQLTDTMIDTIDMMGEGNPGGLRVLMKLYAKDPFLILGLDDMNIRGWQIWVGYSDFCKGDIDKFIECIKNREDKMVLAINNEAIMIKSPLRAVVGGASFK